MVENLSRAIEDYLKVIYAIQAEHGRASTNRIAERMGVTPASVTGMLQKMAANNPPLVKYEKHHGVHLTPEGENAALEVIRHHRLLDRPLGRHGRFDPSDYPQSVPRRPRGGIGAIHQLPGRHHWSAHLLHGRQSHSSHRLIVHSTSSAPTILGSSGSAGV